MEIQAITKYVRMSPLKARLVLPIIKGQKADVALEKLTYMSQKAAKHIAKTLKSAIANAKEKNLDIENTYIKIAKIDGGPVFKRGLIGSRGRMYPIRKSTSHITIILSDETNQKKGK